jgi:hypothetical protein
MPYGQVPLIIRQKATKEVFCLSFWNVVSVAWFSTTVCLSLSFTGRLDFI